MTAIEKLGHRLKPAIRVTSSAGIAELVADSALVATIPARLAPERGHGLATLPCPVPAPLPIRLVRDASNHHAAMSRWARERIAATVAGLMPGPSGRQRG